MAATPSTMVPLGTAAPDFRLNNPETGEAVSLSDIRGEVGTLVMFICNHCPYVKLIADELARIGEDYLPKGIGMVAINANDAENYPADSPEMMVRERQLRNYPFPYLFDETQQVARAYDAVCTPDFFLYDHDDHLIYRGQLDRARPGSDEPVTGEDLRRAIEAVIAGDRPPEHQVPSVGCNIKWKG